MDSSFIKDLNLLINKVESLHRENIALKEEIDRLKNRLDTPEKKTEKKEKKQDEKVKTPSLFQ